VTNIYEGTSQLQVVAVIGKLLGHALDDLLNDWAAQDYGPELARSRIRWWMRPRFSTGAPTI